mmetsp:Transcript_100355/g.197037  ORF Transcript_100355/g.197037 Transcript_100355/m.197037 type:complete len:152 (-) Transcript_100355:104-559(-)
MSMVPFRDPFDDHWLVNDPFRDEFFANKKSGFGTDLTKHVAPLLTADVIENDRDFQVMADLPGVNPADLELHVEGHSLLLKAERKHVHEQGSGKFHRLERSYGTVSRRVQLPQNADMNHASCSFANGVLVVTVPKLEQLPSSTRKLSINSS